MPSTDYQALTRATIGIVGAAGMVGREALAILEAIGVSPDRLRLFGSPASAGTSIAYADTPLSIRTIDGDAFDGLDLALFCADAATARRHAPRAIEAGAVVVDNSSAFRHAPGVPLVVPEVNGHLLDARPQLVANPNCSTILLLLALEPLRRAFGLRSVVVATYQAASGAGREAVAELYDQTRAVLQGRPSEPVVFPARCAFNVFPHESPVDGATGLCEEERKIIAESRAILGMPDLEIAPTCVRVPVERCHSQAITVELERATDRADVADVLAAAPGVAFRSAGGDLLSPTDVAGQDAISISRVRMSDQGRRLSLWVCGDQLRKGAALNAVQIAAWVLGGPSAAVGGAGSAGTAQVAAGTSGGW